MIKVEKQSDTLLNGHQYDGYAKEDYIRMSTF